MKKRAIIAVIGLLIALVVSMLSAAEDWLCDLPEPDAIYILHGRQAVFDAMNAGQLMQPWALKLKPVKWIYVNEQKTAGYYEMNSTPANQRWVFVYPELDPPGQRQTPRDFCVVWIYDLSTESP